MIDIKQLQKEAEAEVSEESFKAAKGQLKDSLRRIASAETVLANAKRDHEVLLRTFGG